MNQSERKFDVLVAGEINPDLILSGNDLQPEFGQQEKLVEDAEITIGSSSAIYACGAARLGLRVAIIGVVGEDEFGSYMLDSLQKRNVDISHVIIDPKIKTGLSVILSRGVDRAILTYPGAIAALAASQVNDDLLNQCRHLHVAGYFLQDALRPGLPHLFSRAKEKGLTISLDTNWDPLERWEGLDKVLPLVDLFLPNENELYSLIGHDNLNAAISDMAEKVPLVAVKLGADGAAASNGKEIFKVPSQKPSKIVDTVGAGDSFNAGFIYGYLQGWQIIKTLKLAVACGSISLQKRGGTEGQATLEEAMDSAGLN